MKFGHCKRGNGVGIWGKRNLQNKSLWTIDKRMKSSYLALLFFVLATPPCLAADHPCASDAHKRAEMLLRFHFIMEPGDAPTKLAGSPDLNLGIEDKVAVLKPIKALRGKGKLDVLEVQGSIYKANYRMRFIYAQIKGSCALLGQEVLEVANPY